MEPHIQYAKTEDGVSIAFWSMGEGPPLVVPPSLYTSHLHMTWQNAEQRAALEQLSRRAQVIHYDSRGTGMSQRDALDFSFEAAILDLLAVIDRVGLERVAVYNDWRMGSVAFACAATHPARVGHLIHWGRGLAGASEITRRRLAVRALIDEDWAMFTEVWARLILGWDSPRASMLATSFRAAHTPASYVLVDEAVRVRSPEPYLSRIQAPTLILYPGGDSQAEQGVQVLASAIQSAHAAAIPMALRPTGTVSLFPNEVGINAILDFINSSPAEPGQPVPAPQVDVSAMRAILWTDLEEHTPLMERLGDAKGREVLREHERLTREALADHGGTEVKAMGDGFMAWFPSAQRALECAIALQRAFALHNTAAEEPLSVRVGVNAGEPIAEEDDLFGASVIAAARICGQAAGGEIVVSDVVRQLVAGKGFSFAERGTVPLKGFEEAVRIFEVGWRE